MLYDAFLAAAFASMLFGPCVFAHFAMRSAEANLD
jgi:hypothetical protein